MIFLYIFLFWYLIGFLSFSFLLFLDWKDGINITIGKIITVIFFSIFGLIGSIIVLCILIEFGFFDKIMDKIAIKGHKNE